jgi:fibronectin type 3 domain-containing protein
MKRSSSSTLFLLSGLAIASSAGCVPAAVAVVAGMSGGGGGGGGHSSTAAGSAPAPQGGNTQGGNSQGGNSQGGGSQGGNSQGGSSQGGNSQGGGSAGSAPASPTNLVVTAVSASRIDLTWTDAATDEDGYRVDRRAAGASSFSAQVTLPAGSTAWSDTSVVQATRYEYVVVALKGPLESRSSTVAATTPAAGAPLAPTNVTVTVRAWNRVDLAWSDTTNETGYRIERRPRHEDLPGGARAVRSAANGNHYAGIAGQIDSLSAFLAARRLSIFGVQGHLATVTSAPEQAVVMSVCPPNGWIDGSDFMSEGTWRYYSGPEAGQTFWLGGPAGSLGQTGYAFWAGSEPNNWNNEDYVNTYDSANTASLTGNWADNDQNGNGTTVVGYVVEFETGGMTGLDWASIGTAAANASTFSDTTARGSTRYEYRVIATNAVGDSSPSNQAEGTTPAAPAPAAPASLVATSVTPGAIQLSWSDASSNETGFRVQRRRENGSLPAGTTLTRRPANGNFYGWVPTTPWITPQAAETAAESLRFLGRAGHLTTITSMDEDMFALSCYVDVGWIGCSDAAQEGTWVWNGGPEDGQTVTQTGFTHWSPGEPNGGTSENFMNLGLPCGNWNDFDAGHTLPGYYVEFETNGITDFDWAPLGTVGANVTSFVDTSPTSGVRYEYRVLAIGVSADSSSSNVLAVTAP